MTTPTAPHLALVAPSGRRSSRPSRGHRAARPALSIEHAPPQGITGRRELLARLDALEALAPNAPLSFIAISVRGLGELEPSDWRTPRHVLDAVGRAARTAIRPTDLLGHLTGSSYGIVLQGAGVARAERVAAELGAAMRALPVGRAPIEITVAAATGSGMNADVLPIAAVDSLPPAS